jgi:hypothetical protein
MAWLAARTRIAAILGAISITEPMLTSIKRVYVTPPKTVQDVPCFIIIPPALKVERGSGGLRIKTYTVRLRCLVSDESVERAYDLVDAFREAIVDAFDGDLTLSGTASFITGPNVEEAGGSEYGGMAFSGMDCLLTVQIQGPRAFS